MSANDIVISGQRVLLTSGKADVFIVTRAGVRLSLGTIREGIAALGVSHEPQVVLVPRPGAAVDISALGDLHSLSMAEINMWATFVAKAMSDPDDVAKISSARLSTISRVIGEVLTAEVDRQIARHDQQLQSRIDASQAAVSRSMGRLRFSIENPDSSLQPDVPASAALDAVIAVGSYTGFTPVTEARAGRRTVEDPVEQIAMDSKVRTRPVTLEAGWQKRPSLAMVGYLGNERLPAALIPKRGKYVIQPAGHPAPMRVDDEILHSLAPDALEFYPSLPAGRAVSSLDLLKMAFRHSGWLWAWVAVLAFAVSLLGLVTPAVTNWVMGTIVPMRERDLLLDVGLGLVLCALTIGIFSLVQSFAVTRINSTASLTMQAATWSRVLELPASFFRTYSSGDLTTRLGAPRRLTMIFNASVAAQVFGAIFSFTNLILLFLYNVPMAWVTVGLIGSVIVVMPLAMIPMRKWAGRALDGRRESRSLLSQWLFGIQKIRMAGLEDRIVARQLDTTRAMLDSNAKETLADGRLTAFFTALGTLIPFALFITIDLTWNEGPPITAAQYMAFVTAFGALFGSISALGGLAMSLAMVRPILEMAKPIMETVPESTLDRLDPGTLHGKIEFQNVSFRYLDNSPLVLNDLSCTIQRGEFVAITGRSGSGKTTLIRQVLGFDTPESGRVLLDGRDLRELDLDSVRRQIGTVLQDGAISQADVLRNVVEGAGMSREMIARVPRALQFSALDEDVAAMPMGLHTMISPQTLSGGQAQKVLLARAFMKDPAILILDEATSALDNAVQARIMRNIAQLQCTRLVAAHRLSTVKAADRVLLVDGGKIVESGTYDELMALGGQFAQYASRQLV